MHGIISKLKESNLFASFDVVDLIDEESVRLIKLKAKLLDGTILYIAELHTMGYQKYSYHWQRENGELIIRWDNKPHWRNLKSFPYHRHEKGMVFPSYRVTIDNVIQVIKDRLKQHE